MNCRIFLKLLKDYITGELSEDKNAMMAEHVDSCEKCSEVYHDEVKVYRSILSIGQTEDAGFSSSREEILAGIDKSKYKNSAVNRLGYFISRNSKRFAIGSVSAAAAILIIFLTVNYMKNYNYLYNHNHITAPVNKDENNNNNNGSKNNDTQDDDNNSDNAVITYNNTTLGFSLSIPESWKDKYGILEFYDFTEVLMLNKTNDDGNVELFEIHTAARSSWNGDNSTVICETDTTVYYIKYGSKEQIALINNKELTDEFDELSKDIPSIIKSFKLIDKVGVPYTGEVYHSDKFGFSFTIPDDWKGRYTINEEENEIRVFYKPESTGFNGDGYLFSIVKRSTFNDEDHFDIVGKPRTFVSKGIEYIVGGPTDLTFESKNGEDTYYFTKMNLELEKVVSTIKADDNGVVYINPLSDEDFTVNFQGVDITVGESAGSILDKLNGLFPDNNGAVLVSEDENFKYYSHGYGLMADYKIVVITKVSIKDGTSIIYQIDASAAGTKRAMKKGDNYQEMLDLYGSPDGNAAEGEKTVYTYTFGDKELSFYFDKDNILQQINVVFKG